MAHEQVGRIVISRRTVHIGHQVYPLGNISRLETSEAVPEGRDATYFPLRGIGLLVLLGGAITVAVGEGTVVGMVIFLIGIAIAYLLGVFLYRLLIRKPRYKLTIETSGNQYTALIGTDRAEIKRVANGIVGAIDNPPVQDRIIEIKHLDMRGSQGVQIGDHSSMSNRL